MALAHRGKAAAAGVHRHAPDRAQGVGLDQFLQRDGLERLSSISPPRADLDAGRAQLFHKQKRTLVSEGFYWFKNYYRKFAHVGRNYRISERLLEYHDKRYFVVPLQGA